MGKCYHRYGLANWISEMILFLVSVFTSYFSAMDIFRSDFKEKREITLPSEKK